MLAEYCVFRAMLLTRDALFYSKEKACFGFLRGKENIDLSVKVGSVCFARPKISIELFLLHSIVSSSFFFLYLCFPLRNR